MGGDLLTFMELLMFEVVLIGLIFSYGAWNTEINCNPFWSDQAGDVWNESGNQTIENIWGWLSIFNPSCSGLPPIIWILCIIIPIVTIGAYFVPFK